LDEAFIGVPLDVVVIGAMLGFGGAIFAKGIALAARTRRAL
jgi:nitrate/nitrite transporter NarK